MKEKGIWYPEQFRSYLLTIGKNNEGLMSIEEFPDKLKLSREWHSVLNQIRADTYEDGLERLVAICLNNNIDKVYLQSTPVVGDKYKIPKDLVEKNYSDITNSGLECLGNIHSHPKPKRLYKRTLFEKFTKFEKPPYKGIGFSAIDLYAIVHPGTNVRILGLIEGDMNIFVLRSQETATHDVFTEAIHWSAFSKFWYEKSGFEVVSNPQIGDVIRGRNPDATKFKVNLEISKNYQLALYKAFESEDLTRVC